MAATTLAALLSYIAATELLIVFLEVPWFVLLLLTSTIAALALLLAAGVLTTMLPFLATASR